MAIVKFVADKNCQLFIDMELVGEISNDKMLKVSLDAGSYFVEAKNVDGNSLKKYELKISPAESQVLQNLSIAEAPINETLEELKNDYSLRFYNQRALFCHNGHYGFINSQYKIVIEPVYSFAENFNAGHALVKKVFADGEKATIIDIDGNISFERWFDYIGSGENTVLLKSEKTFYVLSKTDYSIINQYLDAKYDGKGELIPVHKHIGVDDMYGYIDRTGTEVIPLIFDFAGNFRANNLASVKGFGKYSSIDMNGNLYRYGIHSYTKVMEKRKKIVDNESADTDSYNNEFLSKDDSLHKGFDKYPIKEQYGWKIRINETDEEICDHVFDYWQEIGDKKILLFRKDRVCKLISIEYDYWRRPTWDPRCESSVLLSIEADAIIPMFSWDGRPTSEYLYLNYIIVRSNWKYGIISLEKEIILPQDYDLIVPTDAYEGEGRCWSSDIFIVWKNNMCSLFSTTKGFIFPFEYEDIVVNEYYDDCGNVMDDCTFLMKKNGKYGLIANDFKTTILPFEYANIEHEFDCWWNTKGDYHSCERMLLSKDKKFGIWQRLKYRNKDTERQIRELNIRIDEKYDECVFLKDTKSKTEILDVAVRMANKWAVINCNKGKVDTNNLLFKYDSLEELINSRHNVTTPRMSVPPASKSKHIKY